MEIKNINILQEKLKYQFKDISILKKALTHSSRINEEKNLTSNERLEFLGDAVLSLVIGDYLYNTLPKEKEGVLTKLRSLIVCADSLFMASKKVNLGEYLLLGKGEIQSGGKHKKNIIADGFEAILGAVYLDGGYENCAKLILRLLKDIIDKAVNGKLTYDYKTLLQEYVHANNINDFRYELAKITGPEHAQIFTSNILINGDLYGSGKGQNKKESEQQAALQALEKLNIV